MQKLLTFFHNKYRQKTDLLSYPDPGRPSSRNQPDNVFSDVPVKPTWIWTLFHSLQIKIMYLKIVSAFNLFFKLLIQQSC